MYHFIVEFTDSLTAVDSGDKLNQNINRPIRTVNAIVIKPNIEAIILFLLVSWSFGQ